MQEQLNNLKYKILKELSGANNGASLRELEIKYMGRKGEFTRMLKGVAGLNEGDRKIIGRLANEIKFELHDKIMEKRNSFSETGGESADFIDVTLPGGSIERGHLHPITRTIYELEDLFKSMGFMALDGPELESDYYNFEALNIPRHHPARDTQDTLYIDLEGERGRKRAKEGEEGSEYELLMRTHTSPVQVRAMQKYGAPLRCVAPGRVFRHEATDATHDSVFYQLEGLMIDEDISIANLVAVLKEMLSGIMKQAVEIRIRPGYFPFVEPGLEADMKCTICGGKKCPSCKHTGWLEMVGAGMVHPRVLEYGGIDPEKYSGFAFGIGIDRLVMMKYGIGDIRLFHSGDLRFLKQF